MKKMQLIRIFCLAISICLLLCGCNPFASENEQLLLSPKLQGELSPIIEALEGKVQTAYTLRYPSGGDRKSAVILYDINHDGSDEALAFYSLTDEDMNLALISYRRDSWHFDNSRSLAAGGVERIDFYDLNSDGIDEILVGWEIHGSGEKQLAVYKLYQNKLVLQLLQSYSAYICSDLNSDGRYELFLQHLNTAEGSNKAFLFELGSDGLKETASCDMDRNVKSIVSQTPSKLSSGQNAIYIDELKSAGAVTEVLFLSQGQLQNPLLDSVSRENVRTARAASLLTRDVNRDELLEIPVAEEIPAVSGSNEKCYYTKWSYFNGESLTTGETHLINQTDGFYLTFPEKWVGNIAVFRDSDKRIRKFHNLAPDGSIGESFAELRIVDISLWESGDYSKSGLSELCRNQKNVIVGIVAEDSGAISVSLDELKGLIYIIE